MQDQSILRDHSILQGDFKDFEKLKLRQGFHIKPNDLLRNCGYAGGTKPPLCIDFIAISNFDFMYMGFGYMVKGMSGGPVIDEHGYVVGINSYVDRDRVFMNTLIGIFDYEYKRPKKKVHKPIRLRAKDR